MVEVNRARHVVPEVAEATGLALSILVLDAEGALAEAVARALLREEGIARATGVSDPGVASSTLERGGLDVVVVGTDADDWDATAFLRTAGLICPGVTLVAMSGDHAPERAAAALLAGAASWVPKQAGVQELATVIRASARGRSSVPPELLHQVLRLMAGSATGEERKSVFGDLTQREQEILEYAVLGYSRAEIADELGLSINTVRTHLQHVLRKLGVRTTLGAVTLVLRERAGSG
ncbi:two component transcriptional regulator, LuxR family [Blastococcus fimeti]|nr:two component transcriptional regulator, LuxR family [Blastococcus fimeti]